MKKMTSSNAVTVSSAFLGSMEVDRLDWIG